MGIAEDDGQVASPDILEATRAAWLSQPTPTVTAEDVLHYHRLIPVGMKPILKARADKGDQRAAKLLSIVQGEPGI